MHLGQGPLEAKGSEESESLIQSEAKRWMIEHKEKT